MRVAILWLYIIVAVTFLLWLPNAHAVSYWEEADTDETCLMLQGYSNGWFLGLGIRKADKQPILAIAREQWDIPQGTIGDIVFAIDDSETEWSGEVIANGSAIIGEIPGKALGEIARGHHLYVTIGAEEVVLTLEGSMKAIGRNIECIRVSAPPNSNPFSNSKPLSTSSPFNI